MKLSKKNIVFLSICKKSAKLLIFIEQQVKGDWETNEWKIKLN